MHSPETHHSSHAAELTRQDVILFDSDESTRALSHAVEYWRNVAKYDALTGLQTKKSWRDGIQERMRDGLPFGVFAIDLDKFKAVNDSLGHEEGDKLLKRYGDFIHQKFSRRDDRLMHEEQMHEGDAGRLGGDEFGIAISLWGNERRGTDPYERMDHAWSHLQAVNDEFIHTLDPRIQQLGFGISFGGAMWLPEHPVDVSTLLQQADESMYETKPQNSR